MAKTSLRRGFKTQAEKLAILYREKLGIHPCAPLCAFELAKYLNISIFKASDMCNSHEINLLKDENSEWSALTMVTKANNKIIIHNDFHIFARQQSNVMHEIAHVILDHKVEEKNYGFSLPFGMRDFNKAQEEEAVTLGAALQLSKPALLWAKKQNFSKDLIAEKFNASIEMVTFRMNSTGIDRLNLYKRK